MGAKTDFIRDRLTSFKYAFAGLRDILKTEHNAWVHAFCTVITFILAFWLQIKPVEFALIVIVTALVWLAEAFNTVLEIVIDIVSPEYCDAARRAKDIAATAVLFAATGAFLVGIVILGPPLLSRLGLDCGPCLFAR